MQQFEFNLEDNLFALRDALMLKTYTHDSYVKFFVRDPKLRTIHKASVRDRVLHHAVFRVLYPLFDRAFIFDSYSCRVGKGTHRGVRRLETFLRKASNNWRRPVYALQCDIKKFFDSVDHETLLGILAQKIPDQDAMRLLRLIIESFHALTAKGLPLGNVTSQLFANIYLNEFDEFVKHRLKVRYYLRYSDDFAVVSPDREYLEALIPLLAEFLRKHLTLELHPKKITIRKASYGIDFLGYVALPHYTILRTKTKRRIFKKIAYSQKLFERGVISQQAFEHSLQSYLGMLTHCKGWKLRQRILKSTLS